MRLGFRRTLLFAAPWLVACGGGDGGSPAAPVASVVLALRLETAHFRIQADAVPDGVLQDVATALERELPRFQADLQVAATRTFTVRVVQDEAAWFAEVQSYFGRRIDTSGYVTGPDELRVLSGSRVARNATHELAHCVSLYANPTIANNPRWFCTRPAGAGKRRHGSRARAHAPGVRRGVVRLRPGALSPLEPPRGRLRARPRRCARASGPRTPALPGRRSHG